MTTNPYALFPLDFTLAPFGSYYSSLPAQTPLSPSVQPARAMLTPNRKISLQAIPDQELNDFFEEFFKALSAAATQFSNGSTCTGDTIADISFLLRVLMPEAVSTEVVGITTGENCFRGAWAAFKAWKRFQAAQAIGDKGGMIEGGIDTSRGIFQSVGGAFYLGYRGLMVAADVNHVNAGFNATTVLGKAAFSVGTIGNIFFTLFYAAITAWSAYEMYENVKFGQGFDACKTDEERIAFLEKKLYANPMSKLDGLTPQAAKEKFSSGVLDAMTDLLHAGMESSKPEDKTSFSKDDVKQFLKDLFTVKGEELKKSDIYTKMISSMGLKKEQIAQFDFSFLELLGFKLEELSHQRRKDAKFSRVAGGAVKKAFDRGLGPRFASTNPLIKESAEAELAKIKGEVTSANTKNNVIFGVFIAIGILGLASSALGFLPVLSAAALTALIAVTLVLCLAMLVTDGYFMYKGWGSGAPGRYDKHYIVFMSVMIVTILAISIGTTLGFGLPLFPLVFACIFGAVSLGLCGVSLDELIYKEKKWKAEHPDLEAFCKSFSNSVSSEDEFLDEKVTALFKKLPKSDRYAIRKKYFETSGQLPLKNGEYKKLDAACDFGGAYFYAQIAPGAMNDHKLLLRGIKKTLNFYWKKWAIDRTEESKMIALQVQALFEAVSRKNAEAIKAAVVGIESQGYFAQLKSDLWYVVKREESKKDLMRIVKIVADEQTAANAQQKKPQLCQHAVGILKSA